MNAGAGIATGTAVGLSTGLAMKAAAEDEARRKSHIGEDQIVFESKYNVSETKRRISTLYDNWKVKDDAIYKSKTERFSIEGFLGCVFAVGFTLLILALWFEFTHDYHDTFYISINQGIFISVVIGILVGFIHANADEHISYITVESIKDKTLVQIKKYSSSGYRNMDDLEIMKLKEMLE